VCAVLVKMAAKETTPLFAATGYMVVGFLFLTPYMLIFKKFPKTHLLRQIKYITLLSIITTFATLINFMGILLVKVIYFVALKRFSTLLVVVWGAIFFKEDCFKNRICGALLMVFGSLIILVWGK